jgi:ribosomal protein S3
MAVNINKKRKFVADGVFYAELNELLVRELAEDGYSGVDVRVTPLRTEIIIKATRTQNVLGKWWCWMCLHGFGLGCMLN